ncbi:MAG: HAD superfamily hydrolase (TIGR01509 family) [Rhodothermales bacterium]|jgi:HAD superfamily hydrolase (TIGR01509 family)
MKKAIIFDNDGVLVNTEPLYYRATREMCGQLGKELSLAEYVDCHIKNSHGTRAKLGVSDDEYAPLRAWRNARYAELLASGKHTVPGVPEVIAELTEQFRLCIVTSSLRTHFDIIHRESRYLRHFEFIISLEDVAQSKPSPEPYLKALSRLGLVAPECVVVEDSVRGLQSAQSAGVACIVVRSELSSYMDLSSADASIDSIHDLSRAIRNLL